MKSYKEFGGYVGYFPHGVKLITGLKNPKNDTSVYLTLISEKPAYKFYPLDELSCLSRIWCCWDSIRNETLAVKPIKLASGTLYLGLGPAQ